MPCRLLSFYSITRERFLAIRGRVEAQADKLELTGNSGTAYGDGFVVTFEFDERRNLLLFQCIKKPFWVSEDAVNGKIRDLVEVV